MKKAQMLTITVVMLCAAAFLLSCKDDGGDAKAALDLGYGEYAANGTGPIPKQNGWTRYEAEDAVIFGSDRTTSTPVGTEYQPFYSGPDHLSAGGITKWEVPISEVVPSWANIAYVKFDVDVAQAGNYRVNIIFNGNDPKKILVKLNDSQHVVVQLPRVDGDHQWNSLFTKQIVLESFKAGGNVVWVSGVVDSPWETGGAWANIDCIDIKNTPEN